MKKTALLFSFITAFSFLSSCNSGGSKEVTLSKISASLVDKERYYEVGESIKKEDIVVTATYSDSTTQTVTDWTCDEFKDDTYTFDNDDVNYGKLFLITYQNKSALVVVRNIYYKYHIEATKPTKEYKAGETINKSEIKVFAVTDESIVDPVEIKSFTIDEFAGKDTYTFTYDDGDKKSKTFHINFYNKSTTCVVNVASYYNILFNSKDNCRATLSTSSAKCGEEVTVYAIADIDYALKGLKINGVLQENPFKDGYSHTFTMPKQHVSIDIITEECDVTLNYYYYKLTFGEIISSIQLHAYTKGQTDDTYVWTSSDENVVRVDNEGLLTPTGVREESEDYVKITAKSSKTNSEVCCYIDVVDNNTYGMKFTTTNEVGVAYVSKTTGITRIGKTLCIPSYITMNNGNNYTITTITDEGFIGITDIIYAFVPEKITRIGVDAFNNCSNLRYVYLSKDVNYMYNGTGSEGFTFCNCGNLEEVIVDPSNSKYQTLDGAFYCDNYSHLSFYPSQYKPLNGVLKIHENTEIIHNLTIPFPTVKYTLGNKYVKELQYGEKLKELNIACFANCTNLEKLTPYKENNIARYNDWIFHNCISLKSYTFGKNTTFIGNKIFYDTKNPTEINYLGTKVAWGNINKKEDWNEDSLATVVHCSDGDVTI